MARVVNARLGDDLRSRLDAFAASHGLTTSQAVRLVLETALRESELPADEAWRRAAFREGVNQGLAEAKGAIMEALRQVWGLS